MTNKQGFFEKPDPRTGKAFEHQNNALKNKGNDLSNANIVPSNINKKKSFDVGNKKFDIEFEGTSYTNFITRAKFKLIVEKPFIAEVFFDAGDIGKRKGVEGIVFNKYSKLAKKLNVKQEVLFSLSPEALKFIRETNEKTISEAKLEAESIEIDNWYWAIGGDTHDLYISTDVNTEFRSDIKTIQETMEKIGRKKNIIKILREKSKPVNRQTALYTDQWYEISNHDFMEIYKIVQKQEDEIEANKKIKTENRNKLRQDIFEKAKLTGKKQTLSQWSEECNDPKEDCDIDNVIEYAMPDGTSQIERNHTW